MLARMAKAMGNHLAAALDLTTDAAERAAYALELVFLTVLNLCAITIVSYVAGVFLPALAGTSTAALMRLVSGGAHFESPWRCLALSATLALFLGFLGRHAGPLISVSAMIGVIVAIGLIGAAALLVYAPADTPAKPFTSRQRVILKYVSISFLIIWVAGMLGVFPRHDIMASSAGGLVWQVFTLTPAGFWFFRRLDRSETRR